MPVQTWLYLAQFPASLLVELVPPKWTIWKVALIPHIFKVQTPNHGNLIRLSCAPQTSGKWDSDRVILLLGIPCGQDLIQRVEMEIIILPSQGGGLLLTWGLCWPFVGVLSVACGLFPLVAPFCAMKVLVSSLSPVLPSLVGAGGLLRIITSCHGQWKLTFQPLSQIPSHLNWQLFCWWRHYIHSSFLRFVNTPIDSHFHYGDKWCNMRGDCGGRTF